MVQIQLQFLVRIYDRVGSYDINCGKVCEIFPCKIYLVQDSRDKWEIPAIPCISANAASDISILQNLSSNSQLC